MKNKTTLPILLGLALTLVSFTANPFKDALILMGNSNTVEHYKSINDVIKERFTGEEVEINGKTYQIKTKTYSSNKVDTLFYRKGKYNFYKYDHKHRTEAILIPISPKLGETWIESDQSMKYEVMSTDQRFRTPVKKYKSSIWIKCTPMQNPYGIQREPMYMHYVKGQGLVASTNSRGEFLSYLIAVSEN